MKLFLLLGGIAWGVLAWLSGELGAEAIMSTLWLMTCIIVSQQRPPGYTLVPDSALRWLLGEDGEFSPPMDLQERHMAAFGRVGKYWWRSVFREKIKQGQPKL